MGFGCAAGWESPPAPDQRFGLFVCQFKVHVPDIGNPEQR
jgi:hypothetical protein